MKLSPDALRAVGIYNEHGMLEDGEPMISYQGYEPRISLSVGWHLSIKGRKINGPWYEHGGLTFSGFDSREDPLESARYACRRILGHPTQWVKSPFRNRGKYPTWIPQEAAARAGAAVSLHFGDGK